jgi:hypothetical protein
VLAGPFTGQPITDSVVDLCSALPDDLGMGHFRVRKEGIHVLPEP